MAKKIIFMFLCLILTGTTAVAQLSLPQLVSDGMVLQRGTNPNVWGWATPGDGISVEFRSETYRVVADADGYWEATLSEQSAGGPFEMQLSSESGESMTLSDVYVGDVWVASGQSNMELPMYRVEPLYKNDILEANYPRIRYFEVPKTYDFNTERADLEAGNWQGITPESVTNVSAVAYFFARELLETYDVPIGILLSALGGSPAESWMSEEALKEFPTHFNEMQMFKDSTLIRAIEESDKARNRAWYGQARQVDRGYLHPDQPWYHTSTNYSSWDKMEVPGYWADSGLGPVNGVVWFHKELTISEEDANKPASLELGRVVDADSVFVNGSFVGTTGYQYPPRWYDVPEGVLKQGTNHIVVRVINSSGRGGFIPDKRYELVTSSDTLDLKGLWDYRLGAQMPSLAGQTFIRWKPGGLYNAMISPLLNYSIKGVIWYQGESNTDSSAEYETLFPALIRDWRTQWDQPELPFLYVQLANFMKESDTVQESNWAELREAQLQTLSVPNTAMAVAIDLGEWNDIHPLNKKDVGERLARSAQKVAYEEDIVHSGPMIDQVGVRDKKAYLSFKSTGGGLVIRGEQLEGFALAGTDGKYRKAQAKIEDGMVVVWHPEIDFPTSVRYAWADNPAGANLYNDENLPASPFQISLN